jgi:TonB family protein
VNNPQNDIEIIRKYYNGELSPAAQQELEERALDDPLLQEAMAGIEEFGISNETIEELNQNLEERLTKRKNKVIGLNWGFTQWSIAASLIIFISVLSIYINQTPENKTIAVSDIQKKNGIPESAKIIPDTIADPNQIGKTELSSGPLIADNQITSKPSTKAYSPEDEISVEPLMDNSKADSLKLNEVRVLGYGTQKKESMSSAASSMRAAELQDISKSKAKLVAENQLAARQSMRSNIAVATAQVIKGKVTDITTGDVLPGVQIQNKVNGLVTTSDINGVFKLVGNNTDSLKISYIGYEPEILSASQKDSLKIQLKPNTAALSEVVTVGYGQQNQNNHVIAGPNGGWHTFRKYLDKNAHLPNKETGKVIVQFNILKNGQLTNFKILKTFSPSASETALKLIKNYNSWHGAGNEITQNVKVTVRFK